MNRTNSTNTTYSNIIRRKGNQTVDPEPKTTPCITWRINLKEGMLVWFRCCLDLRHFPHFKKNCPFYPLFIPIFILFFVCSPCFALNLTTLFRFQKDRKRIKVSEEWEVKIICWASMPNLLAVENINGLIRRFFPKGTNFDNISEEAIAYVEDWINNCPMKILNYMTPKQIFQLNSVAIASWTQDQLNIKKY